MLAGKGMWIWQVKRCGAAEDIAAKAKSGGLSHMLVKLADGIDKYWGAEWGNTEHDYVMDMVRALINVGVEPLIWQYIYGDNPEAEANIIADRILEVGSPIRILVLDVEGEYKRSGWGARAVRYCQKVKQRLPDIKLGLSSFRFPTLHREIPWGEFGQFMDFYMPQVYWMKAHNPSEQLSRCLREYKNLPYVRTVYPTGAAFREFGWQPFQGEVTAFLTASRIVHGVPAANLWEWYDAVNKYPYYWNEIKAFDYGGQLPPPPPPGQLPDHFVVSNPAIGYINTRLEPDPYNDYKICGRINHGHKMKPLEIVIGTDGREWWKTNEYAYCAKWLTRWE